MARRHRRSSRIKTAEKTFVFDLNPTNEGSITAQDLYVDLGQVHSLVNRVSARQGFEYVVQSIEIGVQGGGAFEACIMRLPEHWPCINAWEKTMRLWKEQQDDTADEAGLQSTIARYRDFKIHFDADHVDVGFTANLLPAGFFLDDPAATTDGYEWLASQVVIPNDAVVGTTTERLLHMIGDDNGATSSGMIKAYAESRSRPHVLDPNIVNAPTGGLFGEMFDVGMDDEEIVDNFQGRNNEPPYLIYRDANNEAYPGGSFQGAFHGTQLDGQFVDILAVNAGQNYNTDTCPGFVAPCGLIKINMNATGVSLPNPANVGDMPFGIWMKINLAPGEYKGVLAQSMQEANCMGLAETETTEKIATAARAAQIANLVRDNQLTTALVLFLLWQGGAFISAYSYVQGGMC